MTDSIVELAAVARLKPVETLHWKVRTTGVLRRLNIRTVGDFIDWSAKNHEGLRGAGPETLRDLDDSLNALSRSVDPDGTVDWITYAKTRNFHVLPVNERPWTPPTFIEELPAVARTAVQIRFGGSGLFVLDNYLLTHRSGRLSLAEIGRKMGVSREWARKTSAWIVEMFREILFRDSYRDCEFRIHVDFLEPLSSLAYALKSDQKRLLSYAQWESALRKGWNVTPGEVASIELLILGILELKEFDIGSSKNTSLILPRTRTQIRAVLREIERLLTVRHPDGLGRAELLKTLRSKFGVLAPSIAELPALLRSIDFLERKTVGGRYRARSGRLRNSADRYERLLREAGRPLHFREIARRVKLLTDSKPIQAEAIQNRLILDPRFISLPQTRKWALAEWPNIESRTITDLAADLLKKAKHPLPESRLYTLITARRHAQRKSIPALLGRDTRFYRTAPRMWALRKIARL